MPCWALANIGGNVSLFSHDLQAKQYGFIPENNHCLQSNVKINATSDKNLIT